MNMLNDLFDYPPVCTNATCHQMQTRFGGTKAS